MTRRFSRFFDIHPGETYRVAIIACLLFFLIAGNNLIKIARDSIFLGHHLASELPYLYILVALLAGATIATYTKHTANLSVTRLILLTNTVIFFSIVFFWFLLTFLNPGWSHYAFYIWSAIAGMIPVAQLWTFVNEIFTPEEGERLFGFLTAGGTAGGAAAGFGSTWAIERSFETNHLLWVVAVLFVAASVLILWTNRRLRGKGHAKDLELSKRADDQSVTSVGTLLGSSRYLKTIALFILVSVIVSTLIDFEFKAAAKETHPSEHALAAFFSSYYGWLSVATFLIQFVLTGKTLSTLGLFPSLTLTPGVLLTGLVSIMIWPSLLAAALTKMADTALRTSVHRSGMEILYMPLPDGVLKTVKTFLDVVVERLGDATAGFLILAYSLLFTNLEIHYVHLICVGLIFVWLLFIPALRAGYLKESRRERPDQKFAARPAGHWSPYFLSDRWEK